MASALNWDTINRQRRVQEAPAPRRFGPATEPQLRFIESLGGTRDGIQTKLDAHLAIEALKKRQRRRRYA